MAPLYFGVAKVNIFLKLQRILFEFEIFSFRLIFVVLPGSFANISDLDATNATIRILFLLLLADLRKEW